MEERNGGMIEIGFYVVTNGFKWFYQRYPSGQIVSRSTPTENDTSVSE